MAGSKKQQPWKFNPERMLILVTALGLSVYLIVKGVQEGQLDYVYIIGLLFVVIGYFAKELTGQDDEDRR